MAFDSIKFGTYDCRIVAYGGENELYILASPMQSGHIATVIVAMSCDGGAEVLLQSHSIPDDEFEQRIMFSLLQWNILGKDQVQDVLQQIKAHYHL